MAREKEARWGGPGLGGTDPWGGRVGKWTFGTIGIVFDIGCEGKRNLAKKLHSAIAYHVLKFVRGYGVRQKLRVRCEKYKVWKTVVDSKEAGG